MATVLGKLPPERIQQIKDDIKIRESRGMLNKKTDEEFVESVCRTAEIASPYRARVNSSDAATVTSVTKEEQVEAKENSKLLSFILHLRRLSSARFSGLVIISMYRGSLSNDVRQYESDKVRLRKLNVVGGEEAERGVVKAVEAAIVKDAPQSIEILRG